MVRLMAASVFAIAAATNAMAAEDCPALRAAAQASYPQFDPNPKMEVFGVYSFYGTKGESVWLSCANDHRRTNGLKVWTGTYKPPGDFAARAAALAARVFDTPAKATTELTEACLANAKSRGEDRATTDKFALFCSYDPRYQSTLLFDGRP